MSSGIGMPPRDLGPKDMKKLLRFLCRQDGPTAVEYAVLLAAIIVVCISGITLVGGQTANYWSNNRQQLDNALGGGP